MQEAKFHLGLMIEMLAKALVNNPERVSVSSKQGEHTMLYILHTEKSEIGMLLGRSGRNINAIRELVRSISTKYRFRAALDIEE
jgi:predicted RNA-binding protein YlqC (UPF0109 family)